MDEPEGAQEGVLRDVLGEGAVPCQVPGEAEDLGLVQADELLERAEIARPRLLDRPWIRVAHPVTPRLLWSRQRSPVRTAEPSQRTASWAEGFPDARRTSPGP